MPQTVTPWRQASPDVQLAAIGGTIQAGDRYYAASLYVLTAPLFLGDPTDRIWGAVRIAESQLVPGAAELHDGLGDILLRARQANGWTGAERVMVDLAGALFNGAVKVDVCDLGQVDAGNYRIAIEAMALRHGHERWHNGHRSVLQQRLTTAARTVAHV